MASLQDMSEFADITAGWEMSVTMQLRTPLKWLRRHREFHAGAKRPEEALPMEHACWVPVPKTWRELGIDADEVPESTMASQIGQIPVDGGDFLPFLIDYRKIVEGGDGTLADLIDRYPQFREVLYPPSKSSRKKRAPSLQISILNYAEIPGGPGQFHFNFEFHCSNCGGYVISTPDIESDPVVCTACGIEFRSFASLKEACRKIGLDELKSKKLGAFRDDA